MSATAFAADVWTWRDPDAAMVWVVNSSPEWRSVTTYHSRSKVNVLTENDILSGEDVIPGFLRPVRDLFST